jgi:hypothetical protein
MSANFKRVSRFGLVLVAVGILLLLKQLDVISIRFADIFWPLMMAFALIGVANGFRQGRGGKVFWTSAWFLFSMFFFLLSLDSVDLDGFLFFPSVLVVFGIAFLMLFINRPSDWYFLIPAATLITAGAMFLSTHYDYLSYWDVAESVHRYWPAALILFGAALLLRRRNLKQEPPPSPGLPQ